MPTARPVMVGLAVGAFALVLAGCAAQVSPRPALAAPTASHTAATPTTSPASSTPTTTTTTGGESGAAPSTGEGVGIIPCTPTVSTLSVAGGLSAVGHVGFSVHVRNASHEPCLTVGYPGVDVLAANGVVLQHAVRTPRGYLGGLTGNGAPPQLVLRPGQEATAVIESADAAGSGQCAAATAIRFTLPDNTDSTVLQVDLPSCPGLQVHPLISGDTGSG